MPYSRYILSDASKRVNPDIVSMASAVGSSPEKSLMCIATKVAEPRSSKVIRRGWSSPQRKSRSWPGWASTTVMSVSAPGATGHPDRERRRRGG